MAASGVACGGLTAADSEPPPEPPKEYGVISVDQEGPSAPPSTRLSIHEGEIIDALRVQPIYIGTESMDRAPIVDGELQWIVTSDYWALLGQYGISNGNVLPHKEIETSVMFPAGTVEDGLVTIEVLQDRIHEVLHSDLLELEPSNSFAIFLPDGINISMSRRGERTYQTCIDANAFHAFDGKTAYAVFPPCSQGRSVAVISHELAEMTTDPIVGRGWFSDGDHHRGGEVADLCNDGTFADIGSHRVARLWSNVDSQCMPR
ncbi:MAG: hypothetical protein KC766_06965 [Myxococcales bacterium]|nr:hypothetical protein [Myxococcales bacterium]